MKQSGRCRWKHSRIFWKNRAILDIDLKSIDPGVTVKQLLNHTSGVPYYFDESVMDDYEALWKRTGQSMLKTNYVTGEISVVMTNMDPRVDQTESGVEQL